MSCRECGAYTEDAGGLCADCGSATSPLVKRNRLCFGLMVVLGVAGLMGAGSVGAFAGACVGWGLGLGVARFIWPRR